MATEAQKYRSFSLYNFSMYTICLFVRKAMLHFADGFSKRLEIGELTRRASVNIQMFGDNSYQNLNFMIGDC